MWWSAQAFSSWWAKSRTGLSRLGPQTIQPAAAAHTPPIIQAQFFIPTPSKKRFREYTGVRLDACASKRVRSHLPISGHRMSKWTVKGLAGFWEKGHVSRRGQRTRRWMLRPLLLRNRRGAGQPLPGPSRANRSGRFSRHPGWVLPPNQREPALLRPFAMPHGLYGMNSRAVFSRFSRFRSLWVSGIHVRTRSVRCLLNGTVSMRSVPLRCCSFISRSAALLGQNGDPQTSAFFG